jgi:hypothetical protein
VTISRGRQTRRAVPLTPNPRPTVDAHTARSTSRGYNMFGESDEPWESDVQPGTISTVQDMDQSDAQEAETEDKPQGT